MPSWEAEIIDAVAASQSDDEPGVFEERERTVPAEPDLSGLWGGASVEDEDISKYGGIPYGYGCP